MKRILSGALALALLFASAPSASLANDGFSSTAQASAHFKPEQVAAFSKQIEDALAAKGARLAMVFRAGRPRSDLPKGITYTHGAFWIYREITGSDGRKLHGYAVYNLYAGDGKAWPTTQSHLIQDWPYEFTAGSVEDDVAFIIPSPEMQRRIIAVVDSPTYQRLHNPSYTLIANPALDRHQNCNTFMLDVMAAAAWETDNPAQVRANVKANFHPTIIHANLMQRLFGPLVDGRLATDDQHGAVRTASFESISAFMRDNGLLAETGSVTFTH